MLEVTTGIDVLNSINKTRINYERGLITPEELQTSITTIKVDATLTNMWLTDFKEVQL